MKNTNGTIKVNSKGIQVRVQFQKSHHKRDYNAKQNIWQVCSIYVDMINVDTFLFKDFTQTYGKDEYALTRLRFVLHSSKKLKQNSFFSFILFYFILQLLIEEVCISHLSDDHGWNEYQFQISICLTCLMSGWMFLLEYTYMKQWTVSSKFPFSSHSIIDRSHSTHCCP